MDPTQTTLFDAGNAGSAGRAEFETDTVDLSLDGPLWERVFTVAPLVLVGTKESDGTYDLAPKHLALPLGWRNRFGFVCTPRHATYANVRRELAFTASFPHDLQIVQAGLAATRREADGSKPSLAALPTFPARVVDGVLVHGCYLFLECKVERVLDGLDDAALVMGTIVAAAARADALRDPDRDDAELLRHVSPVVYLSPGRFASTRESYSFPFPASFRR